MQCTDSLQSGGLHRWCALCSVNSGLLTSDKQEVLGRAKPFGGGRGRFHELQPGLTIGLREVVELFLMVAGEGLDPRQ
jgi:hypothetical protein